MSHVGKMLTAAKRILPEGIMTFPLLGAAYFKNNKGEEVYLTHACPVGEDGFPTGILCKGAKLSSVCDDTTQAKDELPTCKTCLIKLKKLGVKTA